MDRFSKSSDLTFILVWILLVYVNLTLFGIFHLFRGPILSVSVDHCEKWSVTHLFPIFAILRILMGFVKRKQFW